jgi:hypothetical protein
MDRKKNKMAIDSTNVYFEEKEKTKERMPLLLHEYYVYLRIAQLRINPNDTVFVARRDA